MSRYVKTPFYGIEYREVRYHKAYGWLNFLTDLFMFVITGGLWLIWIFVREMRRR
jgi:hypothetical protein